MDSAPVVPVELGSLVQPVVIPPSTRDSSAWVPIPDHDGLLAIALGTKGRKQALLLYSDAPAELFAEHLPWELLEGFPTFLVLTGGLAAEGKEHGPGTTIVFNGPEITRRSDGLLLAFASGTYILVAHPGPAHRTDGSAPLIVDTEPWIGPLALRSGQRPYTGGRQTFGQWSFDRPAVRAELLRVGHGYRTYRHTHGFGGEVNLLLADEGEAVDDGDRRLRSGTLYVAGPKSEHHIRLRSTTTWLTLHVGRSPRE